ncbi:hypothetical protein CL622_05585 [archaeon]|nr:hypothetical protein [archaeon]|tara:strand:+ start:324 stop:575 length:252 start_codon:yes stop_codon:yes gene_type:complete
MTNNLILKLNLLLKEAKKECKAGEASELELVLKQATNMVHALKGAIAEVKYCETCLCGIWDEDPEVGSVLSRIKKECEEALSD